jgi:hypothetical protein
VGDRVQFVVGDAFRPETWPEACHGAQALSAVGMLHESFRDGEDAVGGILERYAALLRRTGGVLILAEPEIHYDLAHNDPDFYLVHVFTEQGIPRRREGWLEVLERTSLTCRRVLSRPGAGPRFSFYELVAT